MKAQDFAALLAERRQCHARFRMDTGAAGQGWARLAAMRLADGLAAEARAMPGSDRKAQAACLMGRFANEFGYGFGTLFLEHGLVPDVAPEHIAWRAGIDWRLPEAACARAADVAALRALAVALCQPMVEGLCAATGLPRAALWRVVTDSLGYAFLSTGRMLGEEARGMAVALELTKAPGSPLCNRQSGFLHVATRGRAQWFIARGGCCRWLTCPEGEMCLVCVLRPAAEREALLRDHLARQPAA